jgi:DNA (cytosine-5)-methyltransferase 1
MEPQKKPILKAIDFFCGAGGMTCGMKQAGIDVIAGIDIASECKDTYEKNNQAKFIESDLNIFLGDDLLNEVPIQKNDDSMVFIGCSPCQYYTKLHTNKSKSKIGKNLLSRFQYFVDYFKPGYIAIENVPGLYLKREKKVLKNFKKFLTDNSYSFDDGIIDAYDYGVPQHRERYLL